jgi:two-component system chemotaxis sensor kinase CheA
MGTKVEIRLPLTVAILKALMVTVASDTYALPLASVAEIIRIANKEIQTLNGKEVISMRDHALTLVRLDREFGLSENADPNAWHYVVVLSLGGDRVGLLVDSLQGQEDVVIKQMGDTKSDARGIAGATITGDGKVVLILDIEVLIKGMIKDFEGAASAF